MQTPGLAAIARSKSLGLWLADPDVEALLPPADLVEALKARPRAHDYFTVFAPSHRRNVLRWLAAAKQAATRAARIEKIADLAAGGRKVPQF